MKTLSTEQRALIDEVNKSVGEQEAAELECILGGALTKFHNTDKSKEDAIRALAATYYVELPC